MGVLLRRTLIVMVGILALIVACSSDGPADRGEDHDAAVDAPTQVVTLRSLFTVNGRAVAANLGEPPRTTSVEVIYDQAGYDRVLQGVTDVLALAEESIRQIDISESLLVVAHDEICRAAGPVLLEVGQDKITVVHRDVGYGCTAASYHYSVFELPHSYGFDAENLPRVETRVDGLQPRD